MIFSSCWEQGSVCCYDTIEVKQEFRCLMCHTYWSGWLVPLPERSNANMLCSGYCSIIMCIHSHFLSLSTTHLVSNSLLGWLFLGCRGQRRCPETLSCCQRVEYCWDGGWCGGVRLCCYCRGGYSCYWHVLKLEAFAVMVSVCQLMYFQWTPLFMLTFYLL